MPKLGLTMTEGTIVRWLKADGAPVEKGEPVVEILTDKANMEVEAPATGELRLLAPEGKIVPILELIGQVLQSGAAPASTTGGGRLRLSPAARRVARELGVSLESLAGLAGSGPGGRIVLEDVRGFAVTARPAPTAAQGARASVAAPPVPAAPVVSGEVEIIPLTGVRGLIAERLTRSVREAPQFHVTTDVLMDQLVALREGLLPAFEAAYRVRLSHTDLLAKVVARALEEFRLLNSFVSEREIALQPQVNLGVAVGTDSGLVVPVIKNAAHRTLAEVSTDLKRLVASARSGSLSLDDLSGGTFTLSNLGMFGVASFSAILNPPQAGILAVGGFREELRPEGRGIAVRTVTSFTLTCDHRAVDGLLAAQFLARLKAILEGPELREVCGL
jgi:pyruvate dehydrogenase E2 component (dihydrolipoamide acetyltransferase)